MRVAMTGAAGSLGQAVIRALEAHPEVEVVALDRQPLPRKAGDRPIEFHVADVRDEEIGRFFAGCDAVMHLAFIVERGSRDAAATEAINVGGSKNVFEAAAAAGVGQVVYASSIASYGFHADQDGVLIDESAPTRGNDFFYYARHKGEVERWLDGFAQAHPDMRIARLRPSIFLSERGVRSADGMRGRFHFYLRGPQPKLQITHEDDVARAFVLALLKRADGVYNIATEEPVTMRELGDALGKRSIGVPRGLLALYRFAYRLGIGNVDPVWVDAGTNTSLVASGAKARRELGWEPRFPTTTAAVRQIAGVSG